MRKLTVEQRRARAVEVYAERDAVGHQKYTLDDIAEELRYAD